MDYQELKQRLDSLRKEGAEKRLQERIATLSGDTADCAKAYWEHLLENQHGEIAPERQARQLLLEKLDRNQAETFFTAFFPQIGKEVHEAWEREKRGPYQAGIGRQAFRGWNDSNLAREGRRHWVATLLYCLTPFEPHLELLLDWGIHLGWATDQYVAILATALDKRDATSDQLLAKLKEYLETNNASPNNVIFEIKVALRCNRIEAWETVERLLLAAQRQEGLRQCILEAADFAHRDAFLRILKLIQKENLSRFAAVARAIGVWLQLPVDSMETKRIDQLLAEGLENLNDSQICQKRIQEAEGESLYVALWAKAFDDVEGAAEAAQAVGQDAKFERKFIAVHFLGQLRTRRAAEELVRHLDDADLRVAMVAFSALDRDREDAAKELREPILEALLRLLPRTPKDEILPPAIWETHRFRVRQADVASAIVRPNEVEDLDSVREWLPLLDKVGRHQLLYAIAGRAGAGKAITAEQRDLALEWLSDASNWVRSAALQVLESARVGPKEAEKIEPLLARKAPDLRRGVLRLLLGQEREAFEESVARLEASRNADMRRAAVELLEERKPEEMVSETIEGGLGLFDPRERTKPVLIQRRIEKLSGSAAEQLLRSLDELVEAKKEVEVPQWAGRPEEKTLFGNLSWVQHGAELPLAEVWEEWWESENARLDGRLSSLAAEAVFISILQDERHYLAWEKSAAKDLVDRVKLKYANLTHGILLHLLRRKVDEAGFERFLEILEQYLALIKREYRPEEMDQQWGTPDWYCAALRMSTEVLESMWKRGAAGWDRAKWMRLWELMRWMDEGIESKFRHLPNLELVLTAWQKGVASEADVIDRLICENEQFVYHYDLARLTRRKPDPILERFGGLPEIVERCRRRVLEIELQRGDLPTGVSEAARSLGSVPGTADFLRLLTAMGKDGFARGMYFRGEGKADVFSHLVRVSYPGPKDTKEDFAKEVKRAGISRKRLIEVAVFAPQWAAYCGKALDMPGIESASLWLHAHTKDTQWAVQDEVRELWFAEVSERTPLDRQELLDGAVDVEWFREMRKGISDKDWPTVFESAKYAAGGNGHRRAKMYAAVLDGGTGAGSLAEKIRSKRDGDAVRAYGLAALPADAEKRKKEVLHRYEVLQSFLRGSREFGAQRQASEKLAFSIALANLARTAGFADPQRLTWAMEAEAVEDLKSGAIEVNEADLKATLRISLEGAVEILYERGGKSLKEAPAALRKAPAIAELKSRKTQLTQQLSRMRRSLEEAMIRGDRFAVGELREMAEHPLLRPLLGGLLFVNDKAKLEWFDSAIQKKGDWRIAHPVDLLASGVWEKLQRECMDQAKLQPFKQVFRELYPLTANEQGAATRSQRYEGQQVNPKQATAIAGQRGWVTVPEEGLRKTYHAENVSAWLEFLEGWFTPVDVDGLTVSELHFQRRSDGRILPLEEVPPRIFSETMRDLDLVVSVAHRGGVDPEASASSVEMRAALVRETARLLQLKNVRVEGTHVLIAGELGQYNLHLGSAVVHIQPGGALCILPVHSQHRGRVFLPFADNDPKTAEVVSKVLLLAKDKEIKDPTILAQLRR